MAENEYGWWKVTNGTVDFTYSGLASNENGEWVIRDGQVDFGYNGLAEYNGGLFKIAGGLLDNEYTGTYYNDGTYYYVDKGTVKTSALRERMRLKCWRLISLYLIEHFLVMLMVKQWLLHICIIMELYHLLLRIISLIVLQWIRGL